MNVTVFGATGEIGNRVVRRLLDAEHQVNVYVRTPGKLRDSHANLTVRTGGLADADEIRDTVRGSHAVISALGPLLHPFGQGTPLTDGTRNILTAMRTENVTRFIGLATPSIPDARDQPHWKHKALPVMATLFFPNALREIRGMSALITNSGLEWTIARITVPVNKPATRTVRAGFLGHDSVGSIISREDIAAFLVGQLTDTTFHQAAPAISN